MIGKGVLELGEGNGGPVEAGDVDFVDCFGMSCGEGSEHSSVESFTKGKNCHVGGAYISNLLIGKLLPGCSFRIQLDNSSGVNSPSSPRSFRR